MSWQSEQCSDIIINGLTVTLPECEDNYCYTPVNALFTPLDGAIVSGRRFFEFQFGECSNGVFVGLTDEENFKPGYELKAFLYGGNLSDGSSLLVGGFGDDIVDDDKIGVLVDFHEDSLKIYYFHNDKPLGIAFYIRDQSLKPLFPVVQLFRPSEVTISEQEIFPPELERPFIRSFGMVGNWRVERCDQDGIVIPSFGNSWLNFSLRIIPDTSTKDITDAFNLMFNIGNTIFATLQNNEGKWCLSPGIATMIAFSAENEEAESFLSQFIENFEDVKLVGQSLMFTANFGQNIKFKRSVESIPQAVTSNPLNRKQSLSFNSE